MRTVAVSGDYMRVAGIRLFAGRGLSPEDEDAPQRPVVISKALADQLWPSENPLGVRTSNSNRSRRTVFTKRLASC